MSDQQPTNGSQAKQATCVFPHHDPTCPAYPGSNPTSRATAEAKSFVPAVQRAPEKAPKTRLLTLLAALVGEVEHLSTFEVGQRDRINDLIQQNAELRTEQDRARRSAEAWEATALVHQQNSTDAKAEVDRLNTELAQYRTGEIRSSSNTARGEYGNAYGAWSTEYVVGLETKVQELQAQLETEGPNPFLQACLDKDRNIKALIDLLDLQGIRAWINNEGRVTFNDKPRDPAQMDKAQRLEQIMTELGISLLPDPSGGVVAIFKPETIIGHIIGPDGIRVGVPSSTVQVKEACRLIQEAFAYQAKFPGAFHMHTRQLLAQALAVLS